MFLKDFFKKRKDIRNLKQTLKISETTIENAKRDLRTGIKESELEYLYSNNYINEKNYIEVKNAIQSLKIIIEMQTQISEQIKKQIEDLKK